MKLWIGSRYQKTFNQMVKQLDIILFSFCSFAIMQLWGVQYREFTKCLILREFNDVLKDPFRYTVDSLYLELARDQRICSRQREFEIEREKQVTVEIERGQMINLARKMPSRGVNNVKCAILAQKWSFLTPFRVSPWKVRKF